MFGADIIQMKLLPGEHFIDKHGGSGDELVLTNKRLVHISESLFSQNYEEIDLSKIRNVEYDFSYRVWLLVLGVLGLLLPLFRGYYLGLSLESWFAPSSLLCGVIFLLLFLFWTKNYLYINCAQYTLKGTLRYDIKHGAKGITGFLAVLEEQLYAKEKGLTSSGIHHSPIAS